MGGEGDQGWDEKGRASRWRLNKRTRENDYELWSSHVSWLPMNDRCLMFREASCSGLMFRPHVQNSLFPPIFLVISLSPLIIISRLMGKWRDRFLVIKRICNSLLRELQRTTKEQEVIRFVIRVSPSKSNDEREMEHRITELWSKANSRLQVNREIRVILEITTIMMMSLRRRIERGYRGRCNHCNSCRIMLFSLCLFCLRKSLLQAGTYRRLKRFNLRWGSLSHTPLSLLLIDTREWKGKLLRQQPFDFYRQQSSVEKGLERKQKRKEKAMVLEDRGELGAKHLAIVSRHNRKQSKTYHNVCFEEFVFFVLLLHILKTVTVFQAILGVGIKNLLKLNKPFRHQGWIKWFVRHPRRLEDR